MPRIICWFSCGAASAIATKLALAEHKAQRRNEEFVVAYCETGAEHEDNERFLLECEAWFGQPIVRLKNQEYQDTWALWESRRYLAGIDGAPCTVELKVVPRLEFQLPDDIHVFGYTADRNDAERARLLKANYPELTIWVPLIDKGITKQSTLAMIMSSGIDLPVLYALGFHNNNCFEGSTEFLTSRGTRTFKDAVGETVKVRGVGGGWTPATIQSFGSQPLVKLTVRRDSTVKEIFTTAGHRWFVKADTNGTKKKERLTSQLKQGDRLVNMFGKLASRVRPSAFGIAQGIVFGDGTRGTTLNTASVLVLCGDKNEELLQYFPLQPKAKVATGIEVRDLPRFWKDLPPIKEWQSFLYGWLAGYFAADGCAAEGGRYTISSARRDYLEFARDVAVRLGIGCHDIRMISRIGKGAEATPLYTLPLIGTTLREDFFLIAAHRAKFNAQESRQVHPWIVESVEATDRVEEVFCAVVPEGNAFTLAGNIFTGNCIPCVKATSPSYWALVRKHFPAQFERMATLSRMLDVRLCRINGERAFIDEIPLDHPTTNPIAPSCDFLCHIAEQDLQPA